MISMFSAEIHRWNIICVCVLCIAFFLDLLTVYVSTAFVILWSGVNYYLHKRDENFRHRLSILGLIKHDKREQRRRSEHNSSKRAVYARSVTPTSGTPSRLGCDSFDYLRITPGNKFDTPSRLLQRGEVDSGAYSLVNPVLMSKTALFNRSCQSSFTPDHGRKPQLDWVPAAMRRQPIQQEKYSAGSYPMVCLNKSPLPLARPFASPELIAPVRVKILPLATSQIHNTFSQPSAISDADKQDPCSTESVIQALKERRKRAAAAAYQDSLDAAHSPSQVQNSKRARRDNLCAVPLPPPFTPVATSVGGFGPPFLGSPSKNALVRPPMPTGLGPMPEGPFKRGRLPSSSSPPASGGKRHRNNAIAVSYCSSRSIRLQRSQSQKRKAVPPDSSPLSKHTKKEERKLQAGDGEASKENAEDSMKENNAPAETSELSTETPEIDSPEATKQRGRIRPVDWGTIQKKKLVYPEHMATLKEHENDQALDRERLNRLLGSLQDTSDSANGGTPVTTAEAPVPILPTGSLPFLPTPPTVTSATPLQGSTTNTVSVISSPVMSVSSTKASSPKPVNGITVAPATPATEAGTPVVSAASTTSTALAPTKPQFSAGFFGLSTSASPSTASAASPNALLPTTAPSTAANPLLAGLVNAASPKTSNTVSTLSTPFQLPAVASTALPALSASSLVSTAPSSAPNFAATAAKPDQPAGGFVFSGPSLGGNMVPKAPPSSSAFGVPPAAVTGTPATLPTFKANSTSVATPSATASVLPGSTPFQFGSNTQATAQPFKFGSGEQPTALPGALPAGTASSAQAPSASLPSGAFKFGATVPASQITPLATQATSTASTSMFNFGSSTAKPAFVTSPPAFGSATLQSPLGTATGVGAQLNNAGFTFGAAAAASPASGATATSPSFAFSAGNPAASTGTAPFKFGAQSPAASTTTPLTPATTTTPSMLSGAQFAFGAPAQKQDGVQPAFAFGAATTTAASSGAPFAFGAAAAATATSPFAFGTAATTSASGAPFAFGAGTAGSTPAFPQSSATSPLFPSATPGAPTAQTGGFQFGAGTAQGVFGAATNGLSNGISTNTANQPGSTPQGLFKFGATSNTAAVPAFNFNAAPCGTSTTPKPAFNFGGGGPPAANSLFSIGTASSHSERPIARPRSKRVTKK